MEDATKFVIQVLEVCMHVFSFLVHVASCKYNMTDVLSLFTYELHTGFVFFTG